MNVLNSLFGMVVLIAIAVLLSSNRRAINVRTVAGAFLIQISLGALVLFVPWGREGLLAASEGVSKVIAYGNDGVGFYSAAWCRTKCLSCLAAAALCLPCACCR